MTHQPISDNIGSFHTHCLGYLDNGLPYLQQAHIILGGEKEDKLT